ncbi:hypothetical protein DMN91_003205 [Ooceraea biroi]|uniref:Myotubularin phosphatase domain-containing protein n=2 Tax=Ooceraea biroi TaxID=2015173 RepID=A0A3L8DY16_OOCBI|nr:myotubularin-related protein 14 isoform X1 [Ooceraea biroi]XP_011350312.2 myotubularin-related protein 14 isoform X1 [Ooceraea biroi]XP_011350315.2 myotubularin-related protein 14 isoform X1 [Ooceraea biroi]XP_011350316.2 myotubularin-related protein 14 isoform X1 [Ooceraea biroi]XP_026824023.1 myotubularin-related protein 14 isoform X1 [Ooceraea biroi]XP_026824024.1 myotubularin-related protein 14 isoform X1 [Ooceraea biroi]XP_026824025.1 myotubularin-related protein 14 isoform X1 [Oocera
MAEINVEELKDLITYFAKNTYRTKSADLVSQGIMQKCILLAASDYECFTIDNIEGDLCAHYPSHLIMLEREKPRSAKNCDTPPRVMETIHENKNAKNKFKKLVTQSRFARCRSRFPVPVILYKGRHVCRSATLSTAPEAIGRAGIDMLSNSMASTSSANEDVLLDDCPYNMYSEVYKEDFMSSELIDKVRWSDVRLLKILSVGTIVDFMVEKKKIKYGMAVTSSEKVDQEKRYNSFALISLPYPGCEFFKEFRDQDYRSKGLVFNWCQNYVDAPISVPEDSIACQLGINWNRYTEWDLVILTQNYLKLLLRYLSDSNNGILIHCISGWDRTPLFISLLRISLWADGVIHTTLTSYQLLYYTIAYDWLLFGHDLADRLNKGEEILFFCFDFLKYIEKDQFSVHKRCDKTSRCSESQSDSSLPDETSFYFPNVKTSPKNGSPSSIGQSSVDSDPSVFSVDVLDNQDDPRGNVNAPGTLHVSPNKEGGAAQASSRSSSSSTNRTSPIGVPIPCNNTRVRQRNDSTSSGDSWQLVTGTGSLCGTASANALHADGASALDIDFKFSCATCTSPRTSQALCSEDAAVSASQRRERLRSLRNIFYKAYGPHGFRSKDEVSGLSQYLGNIVSITSIQHTS